MALRERGSKAVTVYDAVCVAVLALMGVGCIYEWRARKLPNRIAQPLLLAIIVWRVASNSLIDALVPMLILWGCFLWGWSKGFIGAGDAKGLMILSGLWPGWRLSVFFLMAWSISMLLIYLGWSLVRVRFQAPVWWAMLSSLPAHFLAPNAVLKKETILLIPSVIVAAVFYGVTRQWVVV